ncbi:uncharacterized protein C9orf50 homolog [Ctenodactylus gundi]
MFPCPPYSEPSRYVGDFRRRAAAPELRAAWWGPERGSPWWREGTPDPGARAPAGTPPAWSSLLGPLIWGSASRGSGGPQPAETGDPRRVAARDAPDPSLGALLGELIPSRFRDFMTQLRAKCMEQLEPPAPPQNVWDQPSTDFLKRLEKILLQHPGPPRPQHPQGKARPTQTPRPTLGPSSLEEGAGPARHSSPFRVRFADETLRESMLRYLDRRIAGCQGDLREPRGSKIQQRQWNQGSHRGGSENKGCPGLALLEGFLCRHVCPPQTSTHGCLLPVTRSWEVPSLFPSQDPMPLRVIQCRYLPPPTQHLLCPWEPHSSLTKDVSFNSNLPYISRAAPQRQRGDQKTLLEQESFLPSLQSVLKQGRPKGGQFLLPSAAPRRARR